MSDTDFEQAATDAVEEVVTDAEDLGLPDIVSHVEQGDPVEEIVRRIDQGGIDAIVMGTAGRRGVDRILLGSVTEKTVRSAPVPVVTVDRKT